MFIDSRKLTRTVLAVVLASLTFVTFWMQSSLSSLNSEMDRLGSKLTESSNFVAADTGIPSSVTSSGSAQQYLSALPISELVARKVIDGEDILDELDPITREAVLLYEKSLGKWIDNGMQYDCTRILSSPKSFDRAQIARSSSSKCFGILYAISVASFVPVLIPTGSRRLTRATTIGLNENDTAEAIYDARAGICGEHTTLGLALFARAGFTARLLEFYYTVETETRSHMMPEVNIDGVWYPVDTTSSCVQSLGNLNKQSIFAIFDLL